MTNVTIDDLAVMIDKGFADTNANTDSKIADLRSEMNKRFDSVDARLENLDTRLSRVETNVHALRDEVVYRREFDDALARIRFLEEKAGVESGA
jgi:hypothetical protein